MDCHSAGCGIAKSALQSVKTMFLARQLSSYFGMRARGGDVVLRQKSCGTRRALVAAIIAGISIQNALVTAQEPDQVSREEKNKAVPMRVFEEIFNQKKPEVASEIYSPEFINHGVRGDVSLQVDQAAARFGNKGISGYPYDGGAGGRPGRLRDGGLKISRNSYRLRLRAATDRHAN